MYKQNYNLLGCDAEYLGTWASTFRRNLHLLDGRPLFYIEDGCSKFFQNIGACVPHYTASSLDIRCSGNSRPQSCRQLSVFMWCFVVNIFLNIYIYIYTYMRSGEKKEMRIC